MIRWVAMDIAEGVSRHGYEDFVQRIQDPREPVLGPRVEIIPSDTLDPLDDHWCKQVIVGASKGTRGKHSMKAVMTQVLARLVECMEEVGGVIVIADTWSSPEFGAAFLGQVRAHMKMRGIAFLFLLVGPDGRTMSQIYLE